MSLPAPAPPTREQTSWRGGLPALLAITTFVQAFSTFTVLALTAVAPEAARKMGIGTEWIGFQVSLVYLAGAAASAVAGTVVRRFGAATTSTVALIGSCIGLLGMSTFSIPVIIVSSLLVGITYSLTNPAASMLLVRFGPVKARNLIFSVKQTGVPLGALIGALFMPTMSELVGLRPAFLLGAALVLMLALVTATYRKHWDGDRERHVQLGGQMLEGARLVVIDPMLRALAILASAYSAMQVTLMSFAVTMLVHDLGWSLVIAGTVTALMNGSGAAGRIFWGIIADRTGKGLPLILLIGVASAIMALAITSLSPAWPSAAVLAFLAIFGALIIGWNGVYMGEVTRLIPPAQAGLATGGVLMFSFIGVTLGPPVFALIFKQLGSYAAAFGVIAVWPLIGAALVERERRRSAIKPAGR